MSRLERWLWRPIPYLLIGLLAFWMLDRDIPVERLGSAVLAPVHAGEDVVVRTEVVRRRLCWTHAERFLVDARGVTETLTDLELARPGAKGPAAYTERFRISPGTAPGAGILRFAVTWRCNPVHLVWPIERTTDVPVTVLPAR